MEFTEAPTLAKFQLYAAAHPECQITQWTYQSVWQIIDPLPNRQTSLAIGENEVQNLAASCAAVEKSNRLIWACAAATDNITPPIWGAPPNFRDALDYFQNLGDLDLMALTDAHRLRWEREILVDPSTRSGHAPFLNRQ